MAERDTETDAAKSPTLQWWATRWLDTVSLRVQPSTARSYRQIIRRHVLPALGSWTLAELRPGDVERWINGLTERGLKPSTIALSRRVLGACLADSERDGKAPRNAARA
jgi:integrase